MIFNKEKQVFINAVAITMALQGLTWFALAITGIVVYTSKPSRMNEDITSYGSYSEYLSRIIYDDFIGGVRDKVIRPKDFAAFLWIYAILSALWVAASLDQFTAIRYKKPRQSYITLVLGILLLVTSTIDLVFVSLLGRDLDTCTFDLTTTVSTTVSTTPPIIILTPTSTDTVTTTTTASTSTSTTSEASETPEPNALFLLLPQSLLQLSRTSLRATGSTSGGTAIDCQLANGIVMTIAARGFVMWAINVVLGITLIVISTKALKTPALLTYENHRIPRVKGIDQRKQPSPNEMVFLGDDTYPPTLPQQNGNRNRNSTPMALNNKNQSIYF